MDTEVRYVDGEVVTTSLRQLVIGHLHRASTALPVRRLRSHARQRHYSGRFWSATTRVWLAQSVRPWIAGLAAEEGVLAG